VIANTDSDEDPVATSLGGPSPPPTGFEGFYADAWPMAFRLASFLTQSPAAGEDIAQDAMAKMYTGWGRHDQPHAYLRTTVVNGCRTWHRREQLGRAKLPFVASPAAVDFVAEELADAIATLPFRQRAVIVLRYRFGLSEAEIAEAIGCRPGTVKSLSSRALAQLKKAVSQ
jgi:DNA-directed RNA polymerase specialized sigma24 family protein